MTTRRHRANARTLATYEATTALYRERTGQQLPEGIGLLLTTLARSAPEGPILEIGSAHGRDALVLEGLGRTVRRTDATRAFVEQLRADGRAADALNVLTDPLVDDQHGPYAAVLANAVFLHFSPGELHTVLRAVADALLPGGLLGFTVKVGDGSEWTTAKLGAPRFFRYWRPDPLRDLVERSGLDVVELAVDPAQPCDWIRVVATPAGRPDGG